MNEIAIYRFVHFTHAKISDRFRGAKIKNLNEAVTNALAKESFLKKDLITVRVHLKKLLKIMVFVYNINPFMPSLLYVGRLVFCCKNSSISL